MRKTIRKRMIFWFSLAVVIPILIGSTVVYSVLENNLLQSYLFNQSQTTSALCLSIIQWKQRSEQESIKILSNEVIQNYLKSNIEIKSLQVNNKKMLDSQKMRDILLAYSSDHSPNMDLFIVDINLDIQGTKNSDEIKSYIFDRISTAERYEGAAVWDTGFETDNIVLFRKIMDYQNDVKRKLGYLFIVIHKDEIFDIFNQYRLNDTQRFSLKSLDNGFEVSELGFYYDYYRDYLNLIQSNIRFENWNLVSWTPRRIALQPVMTVINTVLIALAVALSLILLLVMIISHRISSPISKLQKAMHNLSEGYFETVVTIKTNDELDGLADTYNKMSYEIRRLIQKVAYEENQKRKMQLQTLVYQINPHFLYNTLDMVNMLARKNNDLVVAEIVTSLSKLFRIGLHHGKEIITVEDEIQHVSYYLRIQQIRFGDKLNWHVNIAQRIKPLRIIKFILQPIVENSIIHGLRKRHRPGTVCINAYAVGGMIVFRIEDNGVGMSEEKLLHVRRCLEEKTISEDGKSGFALQNINQRIRLQYGKDSSLKIESQLDHGTVVTISLPMMADEECR